MEDLTKQQLVLLSLLVSFVSSIATGIITVALLVEAPPSVPQTVNHIIERTIETVAPKDDDEDKEPRIETITKEVTVTVKEDDLITSGVEKNLGKIAKIFPEGVSSTTKQLGTGVMLSRDGILIAERSKLLIDGEFLSKYVVVFPDGTSADGVVFGAETYEKTNTEDIAFLKLSGTGLPAPVSWTSASDPKLGQAVAVVGGADGDEVSRLSISKLSRITQGEGTSTIQIIAYAQTTPVPSTIYRSALALDLDGYMLGLVVKNEDLGNVILPMRRIVNILRAVQDAIPAESAGKTPAVAPTETPPGV